MSYILHRYLLMIHGGLKLHLNNSDNNEDMQDKIDTVFTILFKYGTVYRDYQQEQKQKQQKQEQTQTFAEYINNCTEKIKDKKGDIVELAKKALAVFYFNTYTLNDSRSFENFFHTYSITFYEFMSLMMVKYRLYPVIIKIIHGGCNYSLFLTLHTIDNAFDYDKNFFKQDNLKAEKITIDNSVYDLSSEEISIDKCYYVENDGAISKKKPFKTKAPIFVLRITPFPLGVKEISGDNKASVINDELDDMLYAIYIKNTEEDTEEDTKLLYEGSNTEDNKKIKWYNNELLSKLSIPTIMNRNIQCDITKEAGASENTSNLSSSFTLTRMGRSIEKNDINFVHWLVKFSNILHENGFLYFDYKYEQFVSLDGKYYVVDVGYIDIDDIHDIDDCFKFGTVIANNEKGNIKKVNIPKYFAYGLDIMYMINSILVANQNEINQRINQRVNQRANQRVNLGVIDIVDLIVRVKNGIDEIKEVPELYDILIREYVKSLVLLKLSEMTWNDTNNTNDTNDTNVINDTNDTNVTDVEINMDESQATYEGVKYYIELNVKMTDCIVIHPSNNQKFH